MPNVAVAQQTQLYVISKITLLSGPKNLNPPLETKKRTQGAPKGFQRARARFSNANYKEGLMNMHPENGLWCFPLRMTSRERAICVNLL